MASLRADDTIASTNRGHGHALAKGLSLDGFFRETCSRPGEPRKELTREQINAIALKYGQEFR